MTKTCVLLAAIFSTLLCHLPSLSEEPTPAAPADKKPVTPEEAADDARNEARIAIINKLLAPDATAEDYAGYAESLSRHEQYDEAAIFYLVSLKMNPKQAEVSFDLASNFARGGQKKLAYRYLKEAVEQGFWSYRAMMEDTDFNGLEKEPEFTAFAEKVKARFDLEMPKHPPGSTLKLPEGTAPAEGWPVILLLHGWGSRRRDYDSTAEQASTLGIAGISIDGNEVMGVNSFMWPKDDLATAHAYLQKVLDQNKDKPINRKKVFLCGFSQGGKYAAALLAAYPEQYQGAIANSPGGSLTLPAAVKATADPRPLFVLYGDKDNSHITETVKKIETLWTAGKQPFKVQQFEGGHNFPPDWEKVFATIIPWLWKPVP